MGPYLAVLAKKRVPVGTGSGIFYRTLTVDHTKVPSTQTDFPVLVNITNNKFKSVSNGGDVQRTDGFDIGFYSDAGLTTKLKWEMESYSPTAGAVVAWVKIASLSSSVDTVFYMGYGDTAITTDQSDTVSVWSNGFVAVYHLGDGTTLSVLDSLGAYNGTNHSVTAATGKIGGGGNFVAASVQYVDLGNTMHPAAITQSAWVKATSYPGTFNSVIVRNDGANVNGTWINNTGHLAPYYNTGGGSAGAPGSHVLATGTWYHVAVTYDSVSGMACYVNALSDYTTAATGVLTTGGFASVYIGKDPINANFEWNGQIDEARVASVARSANWISAEYNNQSSPLTFMAMGPAIEI